MSDFWQRLRKLYNQPTQQPSRPSAPPRAPQLTAPVSVPVPSQQQMAPQPVQQVGPEEGHNKVDYIKEAGRKRLMLDIKYDGVSRLVEPYSFRDRGWGLLFYGHCSIHDKIHSFKVDKIESIKITEFPFSPRWEVEF